MQHLSGKRVALFVAELFEDQELWYPFYRLKEEGAEVVVVGPEKRHYSGKQGSTVTPDRAIAEVSAADFEALVIPGGYAPDHMRRSPQMVSFVKKIDEQNKIIAAICHAGWLLASAAILRGRTMTSFFSIKDDLVNAGAEWVDRQVVRDGNLITSRAPHDLPAFCRTIIEALGE